MSYIDIYKVRMNQLGSTVCDALIDTTKAMVSNNIKKSPYYKSVTLNDGILNIDSRLVSTDKSYIKNLLVNSDAIIVSGDIVNISTEKWLVTDVVSDTVFTKAIIQITNHNLRYYKDTIIETPCVLTNKQSIEGVQEDRFIIIPDGQLKVVLQANAENNEINRDDRFIISGNAYKCTYVDKVTKQGLLTLTLTEDLISSENDDLVNDIADYYKSVHQYICQITNGIGAIINTGGTLQLTVSTTDRGTLVNNPALIYTSSVPTKATVSNTGLITTISAGSTLVGVGLAENNVILDSITITVQDSAITNDYKVLIVGDNALKIKETKTYLAKVYNHGELITPICIWSILSEAGGTTGSVSIVSQTDANCIIKANSTSGVRFRLIAKLVSDNAILYDKLIDVIGLW